MPRYLHFLSSFPNKTGREKEEPRGGGFTGHQETGQNVTAPASQTLAPGMGSTVRELVEGLLALPSRGRQPAKGRGENRGWGPPPRRGGVGTMHSWDAEDPGSGPVAPAPIPAGDAGCAEVWRWECGQRGLSLLARHTED